MNNKEFDKFLEGAIQLCRGTVGTKAGEYAMDGDRFYNFNRAGEINQESQEKALWGMYTKHLVSVIDIVEAVNVGEIIPRDHYTEKLKDSVCYLFLLWAMLEDRGGEL